MRHLAPLVAALAAALTTALPAVADGAPPAAPTDATAFEAAARPLFEQTCAACHSGSDAEGGLDIARYLSHASLASERPGWERILERMRAGEMPPPGVPRPDGSIDALVRLLERELARPAPGAPLAPDPGRVVLRRLNRQEYTNTVRDLLGVRFRADESFPADDSGGGFDNLGEVLSVSPLLLERYVEAAEQIAQRYFTPPALPSPVKVEYSLKLANLQRIDPSSVEASHRFDFDAEYELVVGLPGQRPPGAAPVTLGLWVDGRRVGTRVTPAAATAMQLGPYSEERFRLSFSEGEHALRAAFVGDELSAALPEGQRNDPKSNKWVGSLTIVGPLAAREARPSRAPRLPCAPGAGDACVRRIVAGLAQRAYRRAVSDSEVSGLLHLVSLARQEGQPVEQGLALALQALLVSPHFLFRVERDRYPSDPSRSHRVSDVELASRLSYFLWSSMPDDELLGAALRGTLSRPEVLDAQVARMLRDPKAFALADNFAGQWLEIRALDQLRPDPDRFPSWGPGLRAALKAETLQFFDWILRHDRPIAELLDARYTFLNDVSARHYGIDGVVGPELRRVELRTSERGGLLGQGSVLAVSSYPTRTSVVLRGKYILQNLLGSPPPPPPPDVPALDEGAIAQGASLREQMQAHRANAVCASCHSRMDPLGFGLENYDAIGRYRLEDGGARIDASGVLPNGESFQSPAELRALLSRRLPELSRCLTEKLLTYALGRSLTPRDQPTVRAIAERVARPGRGMQALVYEIVHSLPFSSRRAETAPAPE